MQLWPIYCIEVLTGIDYWLDVDMYMRWQAKVQEYGEDCRLMIGFHGTKEDTVDVIMRENFSIKKVGDATKDPGWFGKGIYFGRRAFTALGYNQGNM